MVIRILAGIVTYALSSFFMIKQVFWTSNSLDEGNNEVNDCLALKRPKLTEHVV